MSGHVLDILTMDEIEEINLLTGKNFEEIYVKGLPLGKPAKVLAWVLAKRNNPEAKFEDFGKWNMHEITDYIKGHIDPKAPN